MLKTWLTLGGDDFAAAIRKVIDEAAGNLNPDTDGDEDTQCQQLFTEMFTTLRLNQERLTDLLQANAEVPNLRVECRYYHSKRRRNHKDDRVQFVEKETGADFALVLLVFLPNLVMAQRHVLGQVKLVRGGSIGIDRAQLTTLDVAA